MKVVTKKNVAITNKKTGEVFYGEDPYKLMKELAKKFKGAEFKVDILNPKYQFKMK